MFGRDPEVARVAAALEDPRRFPVIAWIEGEPGIGKTTLFTTGLGACADRGYRVLVSRPTEPESPLSFAGLRDLLDGAFDEVEAALPSPQRRALAVALLRDEPADRPPEPGAVAAGVSSALRVLSARSPVLLAVDDVRWLDPSTVLVLGYSLRRLTDQPVAGLITARTGPHEPIEVSLRATGPRIERIELGPLSLGGLHLVLQAKLGASYPRPLMRRLHDASGGNPFFALEMARALERTPAPSPEGPLPVPGSLHELVRERLDRLPEGADGVLAAVALLASPTLSAIRAVTAVDDPGASVTAAVEADVLRMEADRIRFTHPLFAADVAWGLSSADRRRLHARLADAVRDPEERARHLAAAAHGPDGGVARTLEEAAATADARGASISAAELSMEARRLTPRADAADLQRRTMDAAGRRFRAGDAHGAISLLEGLLGEVPEPAVRAQVLVRLARLQLFTDRPADAAEHFRSAAADPSLTEVGRCEALEGLAWSLMLLRRSLPEAAKAARAAVAMSEVVDDHPGHVVALATRGLADRLLGRPRADADAVRAYRSAPSSVTFARVVQHPAFAYGIIQLWTDDLVGALDTFEALRDAALESGDESSLPRLLTFLALTEFLRGRWSEARVLVEEAADTSLQSGQSAQAGMAWFSDTVLAAYTGGAEPPSPIHQGDVARMIGELSAGIIELSIGHAARAHEHLGPIVDRVREAGLVEPGAMRFVPDEIEALIEMGSDTEAGHLLDWFERNVRRTRRTSALAAAHRCRGILASARGDAEGSAASFDRALAAHDRVPIPFERGRTLLARGRASRRARRKASARHSLDEARTIFSELGARRWAERAADELGRIGGRVRSGELTENERRVASLVTEGLSNKEVATRLFVTVKTVEATLSSVYAKVGVRSRTALAARLIRGRDEDAGKP
jgi:DNA-binding CsgD family transcriptional regulator/tetratricopeptide (TPR) repeat protein